MTSFKLKKISNPLSVGEQVRKTRQDLQLTLKKVSKDLNISVKYLAALEEGDINNLPGEIYGRSFMRAYASYLGMDVERVVSQYNSESRIYTKTKKNYLADFKKPVTRISSANLVSAPKLIKSAAVFFVALMCLVYLGVKVQGIISPPELQLEKPGDNVVIAESYVEVAGKTEKEVTVMVNGEQILIDEEGNFNEVIDLQKGVNIIEISAQKKHSRQAKLYRQIIVDNSTAKNY